MKKLARFSKQITVACIAVNAILTAAFLILLFLGEDLDSGVVMAMFAPWGIELGFNAFIKFSERKKKTEE